MNNARFFAMAAAALFFAVAFSGCMGVNGPADNQDGEGGSGDSSEIETPLADLTQYVDTLIGTGGTALGLDARAPLSILSDLDSLGRGWATTFPGACVPFGMVKLSPDTWGPLPLEYSGYWYHDTRIEGFSHTHLSGVGVADCGNILFMPTVGNTQTTAIGASSSFSHLSEIARAGYYSVELLDYGITAELAATERVGFHRYTFPESESAHILINVSHVIDTGGYCSDGAVEINEDGKSVSGWTTCEGGFGGNFTVYFRAEFSKPFKSCSTWNDGAVESGAKSARGGSIGAILDYSTKRDEQISVKVGISYVSAEGARNNLVAEGNGRDLDSARSYAAGKWNEKLNKIIVEGGTDDQKTIFYTAMYHSMIMPSLFSDADGLYRGMDRQVHKAEGFNYYTDFSLWDTARTLHPLLVLIDEEAQTDMVVSLVDMYDKSGKMPKWPLADWETGCMVGSYSDVMICDSYIKGIRGFDVEKAYEGMIRAANGINSTRGDGTVAAYLKYGYIPADIGGRATSSTLEFAYEDACIALLAKALGKEQDYWNLTERSKYYKNVWDPGQQFFRGKNSDGSWVEPFIPENIAADYYCEGTAWQWVWMVPHDVPGLIELMGGNEAFVQKLDTMFSRSQYAEIPPVTGLMDIYYWHGNEPDLHASYLYDLAGAPSKTQQWARWIMDAKYSNAPNGLDGNDDCGTLSAWYIFSAMGFYPIAGTDFYLIGSPIFEKAAVRIGNSSLMITANGASETNIYIKSASLNGNPLNRPWLTHEEIAGGGELSFEMSSEPTDWGASAQIAGQNGILGALALEGAGILAQNQK